MIAGLRARLEGSRVLQGSGWILIGLAVQSVLGFAFCAIGLALVLVLAVLAHRLVERPARTWLAG